MADIDQGTTGFDFSTIEDQLRDTDWTAGPATPEAQPISLDPESDPSGESVQGGPDDYVQPDPSTIGGRTRRPRGAAAYEGKLRGLFATAIKATAQNPNTVADSATLILYSPKAAQAIGELAAKDPRIARGIDMLTEGTENPYLAAAAALAPLAFQLARNHEPILEPKARGIRIPLLMKTPFRFPFKLGVRLGVFRNMTYEPSSVAAHVFNSADVRAAFERQGVKVAWRD